MAAEVPASRIVRQAMVTNILKPKIIVFYVAFLPQFLDRDRGDVVDGERGGDGNGVHGPVGLDRSVTGHGGVVGP